MNSRQVATTAYVIEFAGAPVASVKTGFNAAVTRAGLTGISPHTLRHTAASWMVQRRVPLADIACWLGNTEAMVREVYGHIDPDYLKAAAAALRQ